MEERATQNLAILDEVQKRSKNEFIGFAWVPISVEAHPGLATGEAYCYPGPISVTPAGNTKQYPNVAHVTITNH